MGAAKPDGRARRDAATPAEPPRRLVKRSFRLAGHRTSVALEAEFWDALAAAAGRRGQTLAALVEELDAGRAETARPLASTLRVFALSERP